MLDFHIRFVDVLEDVGLSEQNLVLWPHSPGLCGMEFLLRIKMIKEGCQIGATHVTRHDASRCVTMRHDASRLKESAVAKSWSYRDGAAQAWLGPGSVLARWMLNLLSLMTCSAFGKPMASTMIPMVYIYLIYHEFMNIFIVTIIIVVAQS